MGFSIKLSPEAHIPMRANPTDAGLDLKSVKDYTLWPAAPTMISTGVSVKIPKGYVGLLFSRSSYAKHNITLANSVGVIDADYRGEIKVPLVNSHPEDPYIIKAGDKIAQLVLLPIITPPEVFFVGSEEEWNDTARGTGGFGSTGV